MRSRREAVARNEEGCNLRSDGDLEGAVAAFSAAIAGDPKYVAAYVNRAETYRRLGMPDLADTDLRRAEQLPAWAPPGDEALSKAALRETSRSRSVLFLGALLNLVPGLGLGYLLAGMPHAFTVSLIGWMVGFSVLGVALLFIALGGFFAVLVLFATPLGWIVVGVSAGIMVVVNVVGAIHLLGMALAVKEARRPRVPGDGGTAFPGWRERSTFRADGIARAAVEKEHAPSVPLSRWLRESTAKGGLTAGAVVALTGPWRVVGALYGELVEEDEESPGRRFDRFTSSGWGQAASGCMATECGCVLLPVVVVPVLLLVLAPLAAVPPLYLVFIPAGAVVALRSVEREGVR